MCPTVSCRTRQNNSKVYEFAFNEKAPGHRLAEHFLVRVDLRLSALGEPALEDLGEHHVAGDLKLPAHEGLHAVKVAGDQTQVVGE